MTNSNGNISNTQIVLGDMRLASGEVHSISDYRPNQVDDVALLRLSQPTSQLDLPVTYGVLPRQAGIQ